MASRRRKALGQHFLADGHYVQRIVDAAEPGPGDRILEIGPGGGALTGPLLDAGAAVVAVETDAVLAASLRARWGTRIGFEVIEADATKLALPDLGPVTKIVSNLPYAISSPITFALLEVPFEKAVLMYQAEFARRMLAGPGTSAYGRLTAAVAYHAAVEPLFRVPRGAFRPVPNVDSMVVSLRPHAAPPFHVADVMRYRTLLRLVFGQRRKTLRAVMRDQFVELGLESADQAETAVSTLGWQRRRAEQLDPAMLARLLASVEAQRGHH